MENMNFTLNAPAMPAATPIPQIQITGRTRLGEVLTMLDLKPGQRRKGKTPTRANLIATAGEPVARMGGATLFANGYVRENYDLTPRGIIKDLLLEEEQDVYFPKFNVDGLMRGDYQSRMNAYAIGVGNGFFSPNDVRRLENMDLIPHDLGGDDYYLNGSYNKLQDAGAAYSVNEPQEQPDTEEQDEPNDNPEEETDDRFLRKKRRKKYRNGVM